jgi:hypothetical protein
MCGLNINRLHLATQRDTQTHTRASPRSKPSRGPRECGARLPANRASGSRPLASVGGGPAWRRRAQSSIRIDCKTFAPPNRCATCKFAAVIITIKSARPASGRQKVPTRCRAPHAFVCQQQSRLANGARVRVGGARSPSDLANKKQPNRSQVGAGASAPAADNRRIVRVCFIAFAGARARSASRKSVAKFAS